MNTAEIIGCFIGAALAGFFAGNWLATRSLYRTTCSCHTPVRHLLLKYAGISIMFTMMALSSGCGTRDFCRDPQGRFEKCPSKAELAAWNDFAKKSAELKYEAAAKARHQAIIEKSKTFEADLAGMDGISAEVACQTDANLAADPDTPREIMEILYKNLQDCRAELYKRISADLEVKERAFSGMAIKYAEGVSADPESSEESRDAANTYIKKARGEIQDAAFKRIEARPK